MNPLGGMESSSDAYSIVLPSIPQFSGPTPFPSAWHFNFQDLPLRHNSTLWERARGRRVEMGSRNEREGDGEKQG